MDPALEQQSFDPPKPTGILARGLPVALVAHVLLAIALAWGVSWKRQPDPAAAAIPLPPVTATAPSTSTMGAGPAPTSNVQPPAALPAQPAPAAPPAAVPMQPPAQVQRPAPPPAAVANPVRAAPGAAGERVRPSFDCGRARSVPERLICADPELSRLDRDLGRLHARARAAAPDRAAFERQSDAQWLQRERQCRDRECLLRWFEQRRVQLEAGLARGNRSAS